jgi:hypothetical protein
MSELCTTSERLRLVRDAYHDFITLWALDRAFEQGAVADRIFQEVAGIENSGFFGLPRLSDGRGLDD